MGEFLWQGWMRANYRLDRWAWSSSFSFPLSKKHHFTVNISQKLPTIASLRDTEERKQMHDGPDFLLNMYFDWVQSPNWQTLCGKTICLWVQLLASLLSGCVLVNIWDVSDRNQAHDGIRCELFGSQHSKLSARSVRRYNTTVTHDEPPYLSSPLQPLQDQIWSVRLHLLITLWCCGDLNEGNVLFFSVVEWCCSSQTTKADFTQLSYLQLVKFNS